MDVGKELLEILRESAGGPFLFVGSGFSRRYAGLEDWKGLLSKFCDGIRPFEYYLSKADGSYPAAAALLAVDFNEMWWSSPKYSQSVELNRSEIDSSSTALRIEICNYLAGLDFGAVPTELQNEYVKLHGLNVDGIITTNWDFLVEELFPDYRVYIGQEELLFSSPQQIGEIYKIHGCSSSPKSIVLTSEDYRIFNDRNAYLAAKLITIFVEHPVFFLGYSLADENIAGLLRALAACVGADRLESLRKNLIFVQRAGAVTSPSISHTYFTIDSIQIPLVLVTTDDFGVVYGAIQETKRKIPARILRFCKEQLYEIVKAGDPAEKMCMVNIDEVESRDEVEFVIGVGLERGADGGRSSRAELGYRSIGLDSLFSDLLHDNGKLDPVQVIEHVIRVAGRNTPNVPVFKYLNEIGIRSEAQYRDSKHQLDKWVLRDLASYKNKIYGSQFDRKYLGCGVREVCEACPPESAVLLIPFVSPEILNLEELRTFLLQHETMLASSGGSSFRKAAALYDRLRWGW